jgi:hypothetical protein
MNIHQARILADKCGWEIHEYNDPRDLNDPGYWTASFHKKDVAAIWVRFSPTGILTKVEASDFTTGVRCAPRRFKADRLSHYLTEGIN